MDYCRIILNDYHYKIVVRITRLVFRVKLLLTILITVVYNRAKTKYDYFKASKVKQPSKSINGL